MFKFRCMHCDQKIAVPTEFAGRHVRCPGCAEATIVPFPSPEELEAAEEIGFRIRANPSAALTSRACKGCGATLPPRGPCIQCGADPSEGIRAAFDASLATVLTTTVPDAALPRASDAPDDNRTGRRLTLAVAVTVGALVVAGLLYFVFA
jgi:hypothetical protein